MSQDTTRGYLDMELLRFTTAGSVDDGKSTLIGRLLYDSKAIFQDQLESLERASVLKGEEEVNLALLTDGLKAEREQGITIDVAYRYFATPKRKFIIADTPGHVQYTRNMVTGASTANAAIILIDARNGVIEQTIRHAYIASLLQIPHVVVCINKMDLVEHSEERYEEIRSQFEKISAKLDMKDVRFIPISAKYGDNVVTRSKNMTWYEGPTLIYYLEHVHITNDKNFNEPRFPVQYVIRPQRDEFHDYRGYAGRVEGGVFHVGDKIKVLPSGLKSTVKSIDTFNGAVEEAFPPQSVTLSLADDIDISRGDMLVLEENGPRVEQQFDMMMCWFHEKPMTLGGKYLVRHTTNETRCIIKEVKYKVEVNSLDHETGDRNIGLNDIVRVTLKTAKPLYIDSYRKNRKTGSVILIDEGTNETVAAGMIM